VTPDPFDPDKLVEEVSLMLPSRGAMMFYGPTRWSALELVEMVGRIAGGAPAARYGSRREGDPPMLFASFARAARLLGWRPTNSRIDFMVDCCEVKRSSFGRANTRSLMIEAYRNPVSPCICGAVRTPARRSLKRYGNRSRHVSG
jgi:hypothetical protein